MVNRHLATRMGIIVLIACLINVIITMNWREGQYSFQTFIGLLLLVCLIAAGILFLQCWNIRRIKKNMKTLEAPPNDRFI